MSEERFYEVVIIKSVSGVIRVDADMRSYVDEDFQKIAEEMAEMDEGWTKGSRDEQTDSIEVIDVTAHEQARLAKDTRP